MGDSPSISFAILTVSDRCAAGASQDKSGPELAKYIKDGPVAKCCYVAETGIVPDDEQQIKKFVTRCCDDLQVNVLLTTGGTGLAPRDVTPQAIEGLLDRQIPAMATVILMKGLEKTSFAALSRVIVGVRDKTLVIVLPGSSKGAVEGLEAVAELIPHAVELIMDNKPNVAITHGENTCNLRSKVTVNKSEMTRKRTSPYLMMKMEALPEIFKTYIPGLSTERVKSVDAVGHILAECVLARDHIPPVATSMKDGYAFSTILSNTEYRLVGEITPGQKFSQTLESGVTVKVSTGSPVPLGTMYVVPVEETSSIERDGASFIVLNTSKEIGCDIRTPGSDVSAGQVVLTSDTLIGQTELGILASVGQSQVNVIKKPVIAILSTGDELQVPWEELKDLGVRDCNKVVLKSLISSWGYHVVDLGIARDEPDAVLGALSRGFDAADVVVSTGGMSMGERDLLKDVLMQDLGATIHFGRLAMKPGKPTGFATLFYKDKLKLWFGLPGNPASAFVTAYLVVRPALRILSGWGNNTFPSKLPVKLGEDVKRDIERVEYQRAFLKYSDTPLGQPVVFTTGGKLQRSSNIVGCSGANCLIEIPPGLNVIQKGDIVTVLLL